MPVRSYVDEARDLLILRGEGFVNAQECIDSFDELVEATDGAVLFKPVLFLLDDRASVHQLDLDGLSRMMSRVEEWKRKYPGPKVKSAFIADPRRDPVGPLIRALAEANPEINSEVRLFDSEAEAVVWLKS